MSKIIDIARNEVGYKEEPADSNRTKYGIWFGLNGVPWCAVFVSWCYAGAGKQLKGAGYEKGFAGCQSGYTYFKAKGWITDKPVEGDIVLFDWNGDKRYDHTGLFVAGIDKDRFTSIEGNTSLGNNSNGGEVMERTRRYSVAIFVHIPD